MDLKLKEQFNTQIEKTISQYITSSELESVIKQQIDAAVSDIVSALGKKIYSEIVSSMNLTDSINKIIIAETSKNIQEQSLLLVRDQLSKTPVKDIVANIVRNEVDTKFSNVDLPAGSVNMNAIAWAPKSLSGSYISGGMIDNFSSTGIDDKATDCQLSILDDHVVVEKNLTATEITAMDKIVTKHLSLTGTLEIGTDIIDHGALSQLIQMHANMMIDQALTPYKQLIDNDHSVVNKDSLANSIVNSNLRKVGNLQDITVIGSASFSDTVYVSTNNRVGINTDQPRGVLTIRDEDAEINFTKTNRRTMFVGTSRDTNIEIGTNNNAQILLKDDLIEFTSSIKILGIKISAQNQIPEYNGSPNEIVVVRNAAVNQPFIYKCLGGSAWKAINI